MLWLLVVLLVVVVALTLVYLRGDDLSSYDYPRPTAVSAGRAVSEENRAVIESLRGMSALKVDVPRRQQLKLMRNYLDDMGKDVVFDGEIIPVDEAGLRGEWVVAAGADTSKRMLYIHGGAWVMGSPLSHRAITCHYAKILGGAVFALDYRLMPEHPRQAGIDDCRKAWSFVLEHGPQGPETASQAFLSGDSAGGNLTLSLVAWIRDYGLRAPDAAVALSPATDGTMTSPSMKANVATDHMLGPQFGKLTRVPKAVLQWGALFTSRISPSHPSVSPVFGDLAGLPPILVHASEAEMLLDDAVRYVNKAQAAGSPVQLQTWKEMVHVWHIFVSDLPEAQEAFAEIDKFLKAQMAAKEEAAAA